MKKDAYASFSLSSLEDFFSILIFNHTNNVVCAGIPNKNNGQAFASINETYIAVNDVQMNIDQTMK